MKRFPLRHPSHHDGITTLERFRTRFGALFHPSIMPTICFALCALPSLRLPMLTITIIILNCDSCYWSSRLQSIVCTGSKAHHSGELMIKEDMIILPSGMYHNSNNLFIFPSCCFSNRFTHSIPYPFIMIHYYLLLL